MGAEPPGGKLRIGLVAIYLTLLGGSLVAAAESSRAAAGSAERAKILDRQVLACEAQALRLIEAVRRREGVLP